MRISSTSSLHWTPMTCKSRLIPTASREARMPGRRTITGTISMAALALAVTAAPAQAEPAVALLPGNQFITFDTAAPGSIQGPVAVTGLGANQTLRAVDYRPVDAQLFGIAVTTGS